MSMDPVDDYITPFFRPHHNYGWLSNGSKHGFTDATGQYWPTVEHYMMGQKAWLMGDDIRAQTIVNEDLSAKEVKALGHKVGKYSEPKYGETEYGEWNESLWEENCMKIVAQGIWYKVQQNPDLKIMLLATGGTLLVKASPYDRIWGIGMSVDDAKDTVRDLIEQTRSSGAQSTRPFITYKALCEELYADGQNRLGRCWMAVRLRLRKAE